jgi:hypothetical protein
MLAITAGVLLFLGYFAVRYLIVRSVDREVERRLQREASTRPALHTTMTAAEAAVFMKMQLGGGGGGGGGGSAGGGGGGGGGGSGGRGGDGIGMPMATPTTSVVLRRHHGEASEREIRWLHIEAVNLSDTPAREATIKVRVRGHRVEPFELWKWSGRKEQVDIRKTAIAIPLLVGAVDDRDTPMATGWTIPNGKWFLTPDGNGSLGPEIFVSGTARLFFDVTLNWVEDSHERERRECFEVRIYNQPEINLVGVDLQHVDCEDNDYARFPRPTDAP